MARAMTATTLSRPAPRCRVRVWFGTHPIADQTFEQPKASGYEDGMRRRFPGLKVTSDVVPEPPRLT